MRILLIDPPFQRFIGFYRFYFPLGLTYIAAVLKRAGHEVQIYDAEHDSECKSPTMKEAADNLWLYKQGLKNTSHPLWAELKQVLEDFNPQAVGISVLSPKLASAIKTIEMVKSYNKDIITFTGGEHVTVRPQDVLNRGADYVIEGEGEEGVVRLFQEIAKTGRGSTRIVKSNLIDDLDTLPFPALDSLSQISSYRPIDMGLLVDTRGCCYNCTFCGLSTIWGRRIRCHSITRVIEEIALRKKTYGTDYFSFRNGTFTLNRTRVMQLCRSLIEEKLDINWECLTRVDTLDAELLNTMIQAGLDTIRIGIESGSEEVLKYMKKGISLAQIRRAAKILNDSKIFWSAYFMLGVPTETEKSIEATMNLIRELDPPFVSLARFIPLPGTEMYQEVIDKGALDINNTDWTWGANQSLDSAFVLSMNPDKFTRLMNDAVTYVAERNKIHEKQRSDMRLKTA